jgi:hypothetical protein
MALSGQSLKKAVQDKMAGLLSVVEGAGNTGRIGHLFALWPVSPHSSHIEFCI